jgi:hypothetical protein
MLTLAWQITTVEYINNIITKSTARIGPIHRPCLTIFPMLINTGSATLWVAASTAAIAASVPRTTRRSKLTIRCHAYR